MRTNIWMSAALAGLICATGVARATAESPNRSALRVAVRDYLDSHGDLCVGKFTWPRFVTAADRRADTDDAVQLPVLQRLGLVRSTVISVPAAASSGPVRRYSLTAKGRRYYLRKKQVILGDRGPVEKNGDLCVGRLSLDKVVKWIPAGRVRGHLEALVYYTYHIRSADWMANPAARRVFPMVARIIRGQGNLLMTVTVRLQDGKWVPVLPGQ